MDANESTFTLLGIASTLLGIIHTANENMLWNQDYKYWAQERICLDTASYNLQSLQSVYELAVQHSLPLQTKLYGGH